MQEVFDHFPKMKTASNEAKHDVIIKLAETGVVSCLTNATVHDLLDIDLFDLNAVAEHGKMLTPRKVEIIDYAVEASCHAVAAFFWVLNQHLELYNGFSDATHYHSWLYYPRTKVVFEPTPILRDTYYGYHVDDPEEFIAIELNNVRSMLATGQLPRLLAASFDHAYARYIRGKRFNAA